VRGDDGLIGYPGEDASNPVKYLKGAREVNLRFREKDRKIGRDKLENEGHSKRLGGISGEGLYWEIL